MNYFSKSNLESFGDMDKEIDKKNISSYNRVNAFLNKKCPNFKNSEIIDNQFNYNFPFITNNINIHNYQIEQIGKDNFFILMI